MKILIVKLSSLGDVVQTLPVLHDIGRHVREAQIDWVVEEAFADLLREAPGVDRVLPYAQRRWRKRRWPAATRAERQAFWQLLHQRDYDAVIDFQGLLKSAWVARRARLAPGGFSATYANGSELCSYEWPVTYMLNRAIPMPRRIHAVARYRLLASQALGYDAPGPEAPAVYPWAARPGGPPPVVLFAHGTTRADNEWPETAWVELGLRFAAAGFQVALPQASDREELWARRVAHRLGEGARVWPRMKLAVLLEQMRGCSGLVGVDSGVSHMGVALGLPVVQIFSQPRAWRAGPVGQSHQCAVGGQSAPAIADVWRAWQSCWAARPLDLVAA